MKRHLLILILILVIGFFFRTFQIIERYEFGHDADLYSWIVKDIAINHHPRLIGQLTSAQGIFIGPIFYYLLVPFFLITNMDPIGALIPITILGLITIFSYYFVLSKLFSKEVGLIAAFLYAILLSTISADRWVVPTVTTSIWSIWYLFTILMLTKGKLFYLPLLGVLIGLIWHIHIALFPTLVAVPVAIFISKKLPRIKETVYFLITLFLTSMPFILFEIRHNFGQTFSLVHNFLTPRADPIGSYKLRLVSEMITKNINTLFFSPQSFNLTNNIFFILLIILSPLLIIKRKIISKGQLITLYSWIIGVVIFFSFTPSPISEYYFSSINVIFLTIASLLVYVFFNSSKLGKILAILILSLLLVKNAYFLVTENYYNKGYLEKKAVVSFIKTDAETKDYPCFGISYITSIGENVGFRYLFYLNNMHIIHPSLDVPVYNIIIPEELSKEIKQKFGHIGVIPPPKNPSKEFLEKGCQTPNTNLTDTVFGYVE